ETVKPYLDKTFAGEEVHYQNIFKFGDEKQYLDITYTPYRETHDSITGAVVSVRDISNIYQAELALSLQAQRAEALLLLPQLSEQLDEVEFMQQAQGIAEDLTKSQISFIHFINADEETIDQVIWSQRTLDHYGQSPDDSHAPIREVRIWAEALRQRQPVVCNDYESDPHKQELPEGPAVLHRFLSVPVIEDGKVVMVTGVGNKASDYTGLDVETVQLLANQIWRTIQHYRSLQTSRLLAAVVESTDDAILTKTLDSQITSWNSGAEKLLGYSAAEIVGKSTLILFPPGQEEEETQIVERLTHGQDIHHYETVRVHKNGTPINVSLTVSPLKDRTEQVVGLSTIMRDITERKQAEQQILAEMHQRQLLINQLERAKERLEESNQELQNFAYVASHDLQEPLRKIQAFGDRLNQTCQDSLSEKGQDYWLIRV
ncbi:MAG: PAS domain S-box protein, partial [bacterium]